jgi:hypothetical protein
MYLRNSRTLLTCLLALAHVPMLPLAASPPSTPVDFNRDIRPILSDNCYQCHGPDKNKRKADLRLDTKEGFGASIIVPGMPDQSELFRRITAPDANERMPDPKSGKKLEPRQIALIKAWIEQGAVWKGHWAYLPPAHALPPRVTQTTLIKNPVDQFILVRLEEAKLQPAPEADRVTLIRRLYFDLIGLPPTPEAVETFLNDFRQDAYGRLVDQLLASAHYGERMAVFWLDQVRYADSIGYHSDNPLHVAPFRDYVIAAFNSNKPFDRFTIEQLAGDLLPQPTLEQKTGSAYNRLLMTTEEGGAQPKEYEAKYAADRVRNVSSVWLGATMGCCQCHDHKFDPYSQRDFYSMAAFFADIQEAAVGSREKGILLATPDQMAELRRIDRRLTAWSFSPYLVPGVAAESVLKARLLQTIPTTLVSVSGRPRTMHILPRGNWLDESGEIVHAAFPAFLAKPATEARMLTRLDLARWILARDNPLTARVFVNRLWKLFFGQGLCKSLEDFGSQGDWPSHPELLDWLALEFMDSGWDVKHMVKLLVMSNTYRQSSQPRAELTAVDPYNRLLARQSRFRLDAEFVRDNALAVSGLLSPHIGGPSVKPYQPAGYWEALNFPTREWHDDSGEKLYRRGLYTHWQRTFLHPSLVAFDAPSREECTVERARSNIPQQALVLLNDPTYVEAARVLAEHIIAEGGSSVSDRLTLAFQRVLSRPPERNETELLSQQLEKETRRYAADGETARKLLAVGAHPRRPDGDTTELAAWTSVARVLLNLHETITRY